MDVPLKIGVDGTRLAYRMTGTGRYTEQLVLEMGGGIQFYVYAPNPQPSALWNVPHVTLRSYPMSLRGSWLLSSQVLFPYCAWRDGLDIFWGPAHRLPLFLPKRVASVVTVHDMVWKRYAGTMRFLGRSVERTFMPKSLRGADRILTDSQSTADDIRKYFPEMGHKIRVIYLAAPHLPQQKDKTFLETFGIRKSYILFVGTLEPRKNLQRLLKAFSLLPDALKNSYQLVLAGGKGWGGVELKTHLKALNLEDQVVLTGYVSDGQLSTLYAHAYCLAMPSLYEGFGFPLLEAHSFGVPVLTSNTSSMPEVAGDAGVLVDPLDVESISSGLASLLCDGAYRDQLATKALQNAQRFSWKKAAQETWQVFQEAFEEKNKRR